MKILKVNIKKICVIFTLSTVLLATSPVNYQVIAKENITETSITKYFKDIKNNINNLLNNEKVKDIKEKSIKFFIKTIDFIFYDTEINGYTFKELTDEQKKDVINLFKEMDMLIENKYPGYKNDLNESYRFVYNKTREEFNSIDDLIISVIDSDNYENLSISTKETVIQTKKEVNNIFNKTKEIIGQENIDKLNNAINKTTEDTKEEIEDMIKETSKVLSKGKQKVKSWYEKLRGNYN